MLTTTFAEIAEFLALEHIGESPVMMKTMKHAMNVYAIIVITVNVPRTTEMSEAMSEIDILYVELLQNQTPLYCTRKELCDAVDLAAVAIQEKKERDIRKIEGTKPLSQEQLQEMIGKPIWVEWLLPEDRAVEVGNYFFVVKDKSEPYGFSVKKPLDFGCHVCNIENCGQTWIAYCYKTE